MTNCPCCSHQMLRHIRHHEVYWFCRSCWQEMPVLEKSALQPRKIPASAQVFDIMRCLVTSGKN